MTYEFDVQLKEGAEGEEILDHFFEQRGNVVLEGSQKMGIDRVFIIPNGEAYTVEYKTDYLSQKYGNLIMETVSVDTTYTPGWVYTCKAQYLIYYMYYKNRALVMKPDDLRENINLWEEQYENAAIPNINYNTIGVKVPVEECETVAITSLDIDVVVNHER